MLLNFCFDLFLWDKHVYVNIPYLQQRNKWFVSLACLTLLLSLGFPCCKMSGQITVIPESELRAFTRKIIPVCNLFVTPI